MRTNNLVISGREFKSRLIVGTSRFPNPQVMVEALEQSGTEMITVAIRRIGLSPDNGQENILSFIDRQKYFLLPNTAGCYTAKDAVLTAHLAREALDTNWIKLEVIGDDETLFPDVAELLKAAESLITDGFIVLPYCNDDPVTCKKLADMGCSAVMPLGAPIGSGMGIRNPYNLQIMRDMIGIPIIVDAGVGTASDASSAMELGMDGVLMNTAIAGAQHPLLMARAMCLAVEAGRLAYESGRIPKRLYANASTSIEGIIEPIPK